MTDISEVIYAEAQKSLGLKEWPGAKHNPKVLALYNDAGHSEIRNDEVPWCAAFVGAVLARLGLHNTGSLLAKSYLKWGDKVALKDAKPGDVVIFNRGSQSWQGHVAFFHAHAGKYVEVLGGNQGNAVSIARYPVSNIAGIRRVSKPKASMAQSTTVQASLVGGAGAVATGAAGIGNLDGTAQLVVIAGVIIIGLALAWILRERIKKFAEGIR